MVDKITWRSFDVLAAALQEKFPQTDLLFLRNEELVQMVLSLPLAVALPAFPAGKDEAADICRCLKIAWTRHASGAALLDAYDEE